MCLAAWAVGQSEQFPWLLASNRDEFLDRPASPMAWWRPEPAAGAVHFVGSAGPPAGESNSVTNPQKFGVKPRPAAEPRPWLLSGRDLSAGGTWLGLTGPGHLALVTNVRERGRVLEGAPSRGTLLVDWLQRGQVLGDVVGPLWPKPGRSNATTSMPAGGFIR